MRMAGTVILGIALAYATLAGLMFVAQDRMVFFPEVGGRDFGLTPASAGLAYEDVNLLTEDEVRIHGWFVPAPAPRGAVVVLHGNAGNISHRVDTVLMFCRLGYSTLIIDYRGYGRSSGKPSEEGTYRDAEAAWQYLIGPRRFPESQIVIYGESLGGAVAAWLAARHPPRALVLASTFTSVPDLGADIYPFLPVRLLARIRYDARGNVARVEAPVFVAHSRDDEIVPFNHGKALFDTARAPKRFLEMSGGHNEGFLFVNDAWVRELGVFLDGSTNHSRDTGG
jgi:uncharacterized protein